MTTPLSGQPSRAGSLGIADPRHRRAPQAIGGATPTGDGLYVDSQGLLRARLGFGLTIDPGAAIAVDRAYAKSWPLTGTKTAAYTASIGELVLCDPTGGAFTVTIPTSVPEIWGQPIQVKNDSASANNLTVQAVSGNIDGAATHVWGIARGSFVYVAKSGGWIIT